MNNLILTFAIITLISCTENNEKEQNTNREHCAEAQHLQTFKTVVESYYDEIDPMILTFDNIIELTIKIEEDVNKICYYPDYEDDRCIMEREDIIDVYIDRMDDVSNDVLKRALKREMFQALLKGCVYLYYPGEDDNL